MPMMFEFAANAFFLLLGAVCVWLTVMAVCGFVIGIRRAIERARDHEQ